MDDFGPLRLGSFIVGRIPSQQSVLGRNTDTPIDIPLSEELTSHVSDETIPCSARFGTFQQGFTDRTETVTHVLMSS